MIQVMQINQVNTPDRESETKLKERDRVNVEMSQMELRNGFVCITNETQLHWGSKLVRYDPIHATDAAHEIRTGIRHVLIENRAKLIHKRLLRTETNPVGECQKQAREKNATDECVGGLRNEVED